MKRTWHLIFAACIVGCSSDAPTENDHLAPPTPSVNASSRVTSAGGIANLEVVVVVGNPTSVHFQVKTSAQCPFLVRIFPDSTGEPETTGGPSMACPSVSPTLDLSPGDSITLTRAIPADSLALYLPGLYGVNFEIATETLTIGGWAGAARLPLASTAPSP